MKAIMFGLAFGMGWAAIAGSGIDNPSRAALVFAVLALGGVAYFAGRRAGRGGATAVAVASAEATAEAQSSSNSAVNVIFQVNNEQQAKPTRVRRVQDLPDSVPFRQELPYEEVLELAPDMDPEDALEVYYASGDGAEVLREEVG